MGEPITGFSIGYRYRPPPKVEHAGLVCRNAIGRHITTAGQDQKMTRMNTNEQRREGK